MGIILLISKTVMEHMRMYRMLTIYSHALTLLNHDHRRLESIAKDQNLEHEQELNNLYPEMKTDCNYKQISLGGKTLLT